MQSAGYMQVIPLLSEKGGGKELLTPKELTVEAPRYGVLAFENPHNSYALVPSHTCYYHSGPFQDLAMTHAGIVGPKARVQYDSATCVQQYQPGNLPRGQHAFQILPYGLRDAALMSRYYVSDGKLWEPIGALNEKLGLRKFGQVRFFVNHFLHELDQFVAEFECVPEQVGAIILVDGRIAGIEYTPSPTFWASIWRRVLRDCYGALAVEYRAYMGPRPSIPVLKLGLDGKVDSLAALGRELALLDQLEQYHEAELLEDLSGEGMLTIQEEKVGTYHREALHNGQFSGEAIREGSEVIYLSLVARKRWFMREILGLGMEFLETRICIVCGYNGLKRPPYTEGLASYERCDCCGVVFGVHDQHESLKGLREAWLRGGAIWRLQEKMPVAWEAIEQLNQLRRVKIDLPYYMQWDAENRIEAPRPDEVKRLMEEGRKR